MTDPRVTLWSTPDGLVAGSGTDFRLLAAQHLDDLFRAQNPREWLQKALAASQITSAPQVLLAPIQSQEVWAAGVTYLRSRDARMEESKNSGGGTFYDRVYEADRPEIFFKATPNRVVAPNAPMRLRSDSRWNVPEPELALAISQSGEIFGYTIGNDLSSRDIEGENPLYLPQAKVWSHCCALGPGLVVCPPLPPETAIRLEIWRNQQPAFSGETSLASMKRTPQDLRDWLWRDNIFPYGAYLLTGTGTVPPDTFTLQSGDEVRISIQGLGELRNGIA
jgi:2-dehydro-3-deoxy-D-arabinonate dehydratase